MAKINSIRVDIEKELNGTWVPFAEGIELKIARARNPKYQEALRDLIDPIRDDIRKEKVSPEKFSDILLKVRARTILIDWKNIEDDNGDNIAYSPEKAEEFFRDPELKDLYSFVVNVSENSDNYKKQLVEESEKN